MLLEKSKKLREVCQKRSENKDSKSRNMMAKVQSRKTCCEIQLNHSNVRRSAIGKRNSFIYSTATANSHTKRLAAKVKKSIVEVPKGVGHSRPETQGKKRPLIAKKVI